MDASASTFASGISGAGSAPGFSPGPAGDAIESPAAPKGGVAPPASKPLPTDPPAARVSTKESEPKSRVPASSRTAFIASAPGESVNPGRLAPGIENELTCFESSVTALLPVPATLQKQSIQRPAPIDTMRGSTVDAI